MAIIKCPECGCDISGKVSKGPFYECLIKVNNEKNLENNSSAGKQNFNYDIVQKYRIEGTYGMIADEYKEMANDMSKICKYRE